MSDNSINQPGPAAPANRKTSNTVGRLRAPIGSIAWSPLTSNTGVRNTGVRTRRRVTTHTVVAPQRFDVHCLPEVAGWLDQADELGAAELTVDLSEVRFIDHSALDALDLLGRNPSIRVDLVNPSAAYSLTACLVGRDSGASESTSPLVVRSSAETPNAERSPAAEDAKFSAVVIEASGDLNVGNAHEFRSRATELVNRLASDNCHNVDQPIVIDLQNLDDLDAAGLAAVTAVLFEMRRNGRRVTVVGPRRPEPAQFARLTGILPLLATQNS